jgi:uncharacterized membrane protein YkvI
MAIIPGRNPMALVAYYLGVFSFIPCIGLALGIPAIILGILGISAANRNPEVQGKGHAITGLILGIITSLLWLSLLGLMFIVPWLSHHR